VTAGQLVVIISVGLWVAGGVALATQMVQGGWRNRGNWTWSSRLRLICFTEGLGLSLHYLLSRITATPYSLKQSLMTGAIVAVSLLASTKPFELKARRSDV
jgi:hypothetical protein